MDLEQEIRRFKVNLMRKMPFYGDIVMRLPILENKAIPTARTNGGKIEYNPKFLSELTQGQRHFVLMHEVFHVLLLHCKRNADRDPRLWNTAADMIVNSMLMRLVKPMQDADIPFERPVSGIFEDVDAGDTVENLYDKLLAENREMGKNAKTVRIRRIKWFGKEEIIEVKVPYDLVIVVPADGVETDTDEGNSVPSAEGRLSESDTDAGSSVPSAERGLSEAMLLQIIRESASANRSDVGSYFIPTQVFAMVESKRIKWQTLLRDFFTEQMSDDSSYATPERKYIHMDLILPGHCRSEETLEEVWAFVDSSGSIGKNDMEQFLTQLYRISKEFKCIFNICYWDTQVTDVYKKITKEEDIFKSLPKHSGGTDINCVYRYLKDTKLRPDVMLILTDGYFGNLDNSLYVPSLRRKTILVLIGAVPANDDMKRMGTITRLI